MLQRDIIDLVNRFRGRLPDRWLNDYVEYAEHLEWGLAFEMLCEQLFEYDIVPRESEVSSIARLGTEMGIDKKFWLPWLPN